MKKTWLFIAITCVAMSSHSRTIYYDMGTDKTAPYVHLWSNSGSVYDWNTPQEKMTVVAKLINSDGESYVYASHFTGDAQNALFFSGDGTGNGGSTHKFSGDLTFEGESTMFGYPGTDMPDYTWSALGNFDGTWTDYTLTHVAGTDTYRSEPITIATDNGEFVLRITTPLTKTGYAYLKGGVATQYISPANLKISLTPPTSTVDPNIQASLHGTYVIQLDMSNLEDITLTMIPSTPVSEMTLTSSVADNTLFYKSVLPITLTPSSNVASWSYRITKNTVDQAQRTISSADPATLELGRGDNYGTTYTINCSLTDAYGNTTIVTYNYTKQVDWSAILGGDNYYFYGDMNLWSIVGVEERDGENIEYQDRTTGEGKTLAEVYRETIAADNVHATDRYASIEEMIDKWRFTKITDNNILPSGITTSRDATWFMLDMSALMSSDGTHGDGRLCGQFKICPGYLNANNDGTYFGAVSADRYSEGNTVYPNTLYTTAKNNRGRNLQLGSNRYDNAVIYFCPSQSLIYIDTPTQTENYLYYWNKGEDMRPAQITFTNASQYNYYTSYDATTFIVENMEEIPYGTTITSNGNTYTATPEQGHIYRIKLPNSSEHRSPISFIAGITANSGSTVLREVRCEDIWLIESAPLDVTFTTCNPQVNKGPIHYNVLTPRFDNNQIVGYDKVFATDAYMTYDSDNDMWVGSQKIPAKYASGTKCEFYTAYGDVISVAVNGQETVSGSYDICDNDDNIALLYTHLKGTYTLGEAQTSAPLQIEAEVYEDDNTINTSYSDILYTFEVYDAYGIAVLTTDATNKPYTEWAPTTAGWYNVKVTARNTATGKTYLALDRYPVFATASTKAPTRRTAITPSADKVYFWNNNNSYPWSAVKIYTTEQSWPGVDMTLEDPANKVYSAPTPTTNLMIFNNGQGGNSNQTDDITDSNIKGGYIYGFRSSKSSASHEYAPQEITIYFANTNQYSDVRCYAWDNVLTSGTNNFLYTATWPGDQLTETVTDRDGNTYLKFTFTTTGVHKVIFSNNGSTQTSDLDIINGHIYAANSEDLGEFIPAGTVPDDPFVPEALGNPDEAYYLADFITDGAGIGNPGTAYQYAYHTALSLAHTNNTHSSAIDSKTSYGWAKFEDYIYGTSSYDDYAGYARADGYRPTKNEASDNWAISNNTSTTHHCQNWHPAYYRIYKTSTIANGTRQNSALRTSTSHGAQGNVTGQVTRVARTTFVSGDDAMTGVNDIFGEQPTTTDNEYYDLSGRRLSDRPTTPGVYICRQGKTATKVIIR